MPIISIGVGGQEREAAQNITSIWLKLGGRAVDTALLYRNQDNVAKAIANSGVTRQDIFITSKIPRCNTAKEVKEDVETNLKELGTDYIDLLLIHFPSGKGCADGWSALENYHSQGVLKAIGVSHFGKRDMETLLKTATVLPAVNQIELNILNHDDEVVAYAEQNNITIEAFSPLGRSGESGDISGNKVIQRIAAGHNVSTYQVAMKWILQHRHLLTFQSSSELHQKEDVDIFGFNLTAAELFLLDKLQHQSEHSQVMV